jgi:NH3-dependent NAD+ synthetase
MVVGTGDLSELALGWCTYGVGDQMSHYNPNSGVPKTLIQHLIRFVAASGDVDAATSDLLEDILATEISPELVPGEAVQATESFVGPYALQDFNLYYLTRYGMAPSKIAFLAWTAWHDAAAGAWPVGNPRGRPARLRPAGDQALAGAVPEAVLRQPVQALGHAQRAEDLVGRRPVAARRLAHAVGRHRRRLAGRACRGNAGLSLGAACTVPALAC